ncbi:hypothetical protein CONPUDRAFT_160654 [Coniophora puteana RWD-64-598 SS2]|uniref:Uncharacterized protein n=1 Tax=Coniophora puteana (strain RWD-64-598) TaxID=741705 RepID=R7SFI3_CONPW|nr:uncharacterized protein CONPUDRAFT_160654 [Coniophora puteana RWD-64-598 SS2]EIW73839.1 hypothetical protein CONPUDRAFT_160654 [Coniophora puteana RWD-64-598 SS2]
MADQPTTRPNTRAKTDESKAVAQVREQLPQKKRRTRKEVEDDASKRAEEQAEKEEQAKDNVAAIELKMAQKQKQTKPKPKPRAMPRLAPTAADPPAAVTMPAPKAPTSTKSVSASVADGTIQVKLRREKKSRDERAVTRKDIEARRKHQEANEADIQKSARNGNASIVLQPRTFQLKSIPRIVDWTANIPADTRSGPSNTSRSKSTASTAFTNATSVSKTSKAGSALSQTSKTSSNTRQAPAPAPAPAPVEKELDEAPGLRDDDEPEDIAKERDYVVNAQSNRTLVSVNRDSTPDVSPPTQNILPRSTPLKRHFDDVQAAALESDEDDEALSNERIFIGCDELEVGTDPRQTGNEGGKSVNSPEDNDDQEDVDKDRSGDEEMEEVDHADHGSDMHEDGPEDIELDPNVRLQDAGVEAQQEPAEDNDDRYDDIMEVQQGGGDDAAITEPLSLGSRSRTTNSMHAKASKPDEHPAKRAKVAPGGDRYTSASHRSVSSSHRSVSSSHRIPSSSRAPVSQRSEGGVVSGNTPTSQAVTEPINVKPPLKGKKYTMDDLPAGSRDERKFSGKYMPTVCMYYGAQDYDAVWKDEELPELIKKIWRVVYGSLPPPEHLPAIVSVTVDRLYLWRNNFSSTTVSALLFVFAGSNTIEEEERITYSKELLLHNAFVYEKFENGRPFGSFRGSYFLMVLSCHFQAIQGFVRVPDLAKYHEPEYLPYGAFALAASAACRALEMNIEGKLGNVGDALESTIRSGCSANSEGFTKAKKYMAQANAKARPKKGRARKAKAKAKGKKKQADDSDGNASDNVAEDQAQAAGAPASAASTPAAPSASAPLPFSKDHYGKLTKRFWTSIHQADDERIIDAFALAGELIQRDDSEESDSGSSGKSSDNEFLVVNA